jgi:predicted component of type VI protein secretion system
LDTLNNIQQEIAQLAQDFRAEAVVAQLLPHTGDAPPLVVHTDDFFYRRFSRDITRTELDDTTGITPMLHIHLSRAGLYDLLPEGLFFNQQSNSKVPQTAAEMAEEYKQNKKQEQEVRKFFSPLENEFFLHRYKNFSAESQLLQGLQNETINRYFARFWQLPDNMPLAMTQRLVLLLPYVHEMAGDCQLMAEALQAILGEPVQCRLQSCQAQQTQLCYNQLGHFALGGTLTCGQDYEEESIGFVFSIGPLQKRAAQDFLTGGQLYSTLQSFYRFFVPAGTDITVQIILSATKEDMHIGHDERSVLGIATVL